MAKSTTEKCNPPGGTLTDVYHTVITDENGYRHEGYGNSPEESGRVASRMRDLDTNNPWYSSSSSGSSSSSQQSNSSGLERAVESSSSSGYGGGGGDYVPNIPKVKKNIDDPNDVSPAGWTLFYATMGITFLFTLGMCASRY